MNDLPLYLQIDISEFTFSRQQLKTCVKLGNAFTRLLLFLTKDVDVVINTLLGFKVIGKRFDSYFVLIISFGRFRYGKGFKNITGFLSNIVQ